MTPNCAYAGQLESLSAMFYIPGMAKKKNQDAVRLGRLGGLARAKKLSKEELSKIGKLGAPFGKLGGRPKKKILPKE